MKKKKYKEGQMIDVFKPVLMTIEFLLAFICLYFCMKDDNFIYGVCAIFFGWQAGWGMRVIEYHENKEKNNNV